MNQLLISALCGTLVFTQLPLSIANTNNSQEMLLNEGSDSSLRAQLKNICSNPLSLFQQDHHIKSIRIPYDDFITLQKNLVLTNSDAAIDSISKILNSTTCLKDGVYAVIRSLLSITLPPPPPPQPQPEEGMESFSKENMRYITLDNDQALRAAEEPLINKINPEVLSALATQSVPSKFGPQTVLHMAIIYDFLNHRLNEFFSGKEAPFERTRALNSIGLKLVESLSIEKRITLLRSKNTLESTPLHYAVLISSNANFFKALIDGVAKKDRIELLSQKNILGSTPMHYAALNPYSTEIINTILKDLSTEEKLGLLSAKNASNTTPLHLAAFTNHPAIIKQSLFLEMQRDIQKTKNATLLNTTLLSKNNDDVSVVDCGIMAMAFHSQLPVAAFLQVLSPAERAALISTATSTNATLILMIRTLSSNRDYYYEKQRCSNGADLALFAALINAASNSPFIMQNAEGFIQKVVKVFTMISSVLPDLAFALYQDSPINSL